MEGKELLKCGLEELGINAEPEKIDKLFRFGELLLKWNKVYNLTSIRNFQDVVIRHILDSASYAAFLSKNFSSDYFCLDVGSGGGLPGIPSAILLSDFQFTLVEPIGKKIRFLNQAKIELGLGNLFPVQGKVEDLSRGTQFNVISSRAFSSLENFLSLTSGLLKKDGVWIAMKAKITPQELRGIENGNRTFEIFPVVVPFLHEERNFVVIKQGS